MHPHSSLHAHHDYKYLYDSQEMQAATMMTWGSAQLDVLCTWQPSCERISLQMALRDLGPEAHRRGAHMDQRTGAPSGHRPCTP